MDANVTLIVTRGPLSGQKFDFTEPVSCSIGRSRDCTIRLPQEVEHLEISRRHCLLEIDPPALRVRDLGSLHGTFVNGKKIGQRSRPLSASDTEAGEQPAVVLLDGDEIQLGERTAFRVCISNGEERKAARKTHRSSGELHFAELI
jgi:serine/threonine-protein kinase